MDQATYVKGFHVDEAVSKMAYNILGDTGMSVSALSLGKITASIQNTNAFARMSTSFEIRFYKRPLGLE